MTDRPDLGTARRAFAALRERGDPALDQVFPFQLRVGRDLIEARTARARLRHAALAEAGQQLAVAGVVAAAVAALLLDWPWWPLPAALVLVLLMLGLRHWTGRRAGPVMAWPQEAEVVLAAAVQVHPSLAEPGANPAPAAFLVQLPGGAAAIAADELRAGAARCAGLGADEPAAAWLRESREFQRFDRCAVPPQVAGFADAWLVGAVVYRRQVAGGVLRPGDVRLLALRPHADEPGDLLPVDLLAAPE